MFYITSKVSASLKRLFYKYFSIFFVNHTKVYIITTIQLCIQL